MCNCVCAGKQPTGHVRLQQSEDEQEADGEEEDDEDEYGDKAEVWKPMDGADALRRRGVGVTEEDT